MKMKTTVLLMFVLLASCSSIANLMPKKKIYSSIPDTMTSARTSLFKVNEIDYHKEGPVTLPGQDSEWFVKTELPSMLRVLGTKSKLTITEDTSTSPDYTIDIWIHEMEKANAIPRQNTITIILTISNSENERGEVIFVDETLYSILNSSYAHKAFASILKKLAGAMK
jgi:hypothetical protein